MLKQLRQKKTMKRILWALAILIIPPFVFWGGGSALRTRQKGPAYAGSIFGKKVTFEEYARTWQAVRNQAMLMYGSRLEEIYDALNVDQQAWDRLILLKEAKRQRIKIPDEEVIDTIQKFPFFQSRGGFDKKAYELILSQVFRTDARQFEEEIRGGIAISKLRDSVIKDLDMTEEELKDEYKRENEKASIDYLLISPDAFKKDITISENMLTGYYEDSKESFRIDEQINLQCIGFEFSDYEKDVHLKEEEIKQYYDEHKDEFDEKKGFEAQKDAIKIMLTQKIAKEKALMAAEKIDYRLADKTRTFDEVAKENSILVKETGFFGKEGPIPQIGWFPEIQKIAFKLKTGERSELIKSKTGFAKGYYIVQVKEKRAPRILSFEESKANIDAILRAQAGLKLASKEAQRLYKKMTELKKTSNLNFHEAAAMIHYKVNHTGPFTRNGYVQGLGTAGELGEEAFNLNKDLIPPVAKVRAGFCIFTVKEVSTIDEEKFKKDKDEFRKKALEEKRSKILNGWYLGLIEKANLKSNIQPSF